MTQCTHTIHELHTNLNHLSTTTWRNRNLAALPAGRRASWHLHFAVVKISRQDSLLTDRITGDHLLSGLRRPQRPSKCTQPDFWLLSSQAHSPSHGPLWDLILEKNRYGSEWSENFFFFFFFLSRNTYYTITYMMFVNSRANFLTWGSRSLSKNVCQQSHLSGVVSFNSQQNLVEPLLYISLLVELTNYPFS